MWNRLVTSAFVLTALGLLHCSASPDASTASSDSASSILTGTRDWSKHPAVAQVDDAREIFAVSDAHGELDSLSRLLAANHLAKEGKTGVWTGGRAVLVIAGDLIDKGPESLEVIDYVRALEAGAARAGGRVIATMGNHEAEFLNDPKNDKATSHGEDAEGIDRELDAANVDPKSLAKGTDHEGRGQWLQSMPLAARVGSWFFCHAGNTSELSIKDLEKTLEHGIDKNGYGDKDITGGHSLLEAESWYDDPKSDKAGKKAANALGVEHIVFGHDPGAMGTHKVASSRNGILVRIDTAMGLHDGHSTNPAYLLHVNASGVAEVLDEGGHAEPLKAL